MCEREREGHNSIKRRLGFGVFIEVGDREGFLVWGRKMGVRKKARGWTGNAVLLAKWVFGRSMLGLF